MNWAWATSLEQLWRSPGFPMWLTLAAAGFFAVIVLITQLRAERSVGNGALTVVTLLAIAVAAAATVRSYGPAGQGTAASAAPPAITASLPALSCLDDLAGDTVLAACEKVLFGSAESAAAAVSYAAAKISRLAAYGDVAAANEVMTPDLMALRRTVERDRYGLIAYVLQTRERCQAASCSVYASLTDHNRIAANMEERTYDGLITRYAPAWNAPPAAAAAVTGALAGLPLSIPTGKPTTADFPSSASIPPINIMTPEPAAPAPRTPTAPKASPAAANAQDPRPSVSAAATAPAAKKPAAPKAPRPQAQTPVNLAPAAAAPDN
ncbi:MAG: hypothetical protein JWR89_959 [Tardiphaga sp.]|uniref:hypothetical protein n=1 Tax=Tardiphaga sp. TaxID=1926292 RepID=UPI0026041EDC|nr:hypothetical protein [Tardiphaga sp.]MDB5501057.1 hypothetical protein [Tardiphaga sp.]